ncbi:translation initiation factor IF-2 [Patescibacteria group bacterium]|nr:translation initiation factor IF-2 [Patescibacteria group bacterium]MBU1721942.1 translation initiation factor IF-2 [Patescibacteria group bacterium]MBU1901786.1 translation initiation factor IF-2 [Patescibacteria group bacterium]
MNVTELARRLRVHPKELLRILPEYGFDVGMKAVKVDNKVAQQIMRAWPKIKRDLEKKRKQEQEEKRNKEKELRKESGHLVLLPSRITVREFSEKLELPISQVITELMRNGVLANQNQFIDFDTAGVIAEELGFFVEAEEVQDVDIQKEVEQSSAVEEALTNAINVEKRDPVIIVMGHVDHGKTKLLDTIREANIIDTESGGITQHIGAYQTMWKDPKTKEERALTFIDTPGHEAFTVMRSRGAKVADIGILVVAADDGVKPQTKEVIQILKAAKLPFVVAINKVDKEAADVQRTKTELSQHGVIAEDWGGTVPMVEISAKEKLHIDKLLDVLLLVADVHEANIQADKTIDAIGTVIESHVDKHMGPVATILIQAGTLKKGSPLVIHNEIYGKVKAMKDYTGKMIDEAGPSVPVQIMGFKVAPEVGDVLNVGDVKNAKKIDVKQKRNEQTGAQKQTMKIEDHSGDDEKKHKTLNLVIKADVLGSLEAIIGSFDKVLHDEVGIKIIGKGLGNITGDDVSKAESGNGHLIAFNVKPSSSAEEILREKRMPVHKFEVIYGLLDWVNEELEKLLDVEIVVTEIGTFEVRAIFRTEKKQMIVGGLAKTGKLMPNTLARVVRDGEHIAVGKIISCQIGQQEEKKVSAGSECGLRFEGKEKLIEGDIIEVYTEEKRVRKLELS